MTTTILRFQEALLPGWIKQQVGHVEETRQETLGFY